MELVADDVYTVQKGNQQSEEDEQAPAGAKAVFADEHFVETRGRRGEHRSGRGRRCIVIQWASSCGLNLLEACIIALNRHFLSVFAITLWPLYFNL